MTAKYIVFSISVVLDSTLSICIQESHLILKKSIILLHTLSTCNSLLVRYKVYLSDPSECLWKQAEDMVKLMKMLALIKQHVERI